MDLSKIKKGIINNLTPDKTEEIKPGLFIQQIGNNKYRQIYPAAWNNKLNWKNTLLGGDQWLKHLITFLILMFIVFGYVHDHKALLEQNNLIREDPIGFCNNLIQQNVDPINISYDYGITNTITLPDLP
jgi:hypothetical protein